MRKIRLLFLINDYYINNFKIIYEKCKKSNFFDVIVVATNYYIDGKIDRKSSDIKKHLESNNIKCIDSFDRKSNDYKDLKQLNPDYIFVLTPYEIYFPKCYSFEKLSVFSRLCTISYGTRIVANDGNYKNFIENNSFYKLAWKVYVESEESIQDLSEEVKRIFKVVGSLKMEDYYANKKIDKNKKFTVAWKPRWTFIDGESCFKEYIEKYYEFFLKNPKINLLLYIHPLFYRSLKKTDNSMQYQEWIKKICKLSNVEVIDNYKFLEKVLSSDVFVADHSSTLVEYASTGKPVIFPKSNIKLNKLGIRIIKNCYIAKDVEQSIDYIKKLYLKNDILKDQREKESKSYFYNDKNKTCVSDKILEDIKLDFGYTEVLFEKYQGLNVENQLKTEMQKELEESLKKIINSNSWKITMPIRKIRMNFNRKR